MERIKILIRIVLQFLLLSLSYYVLVYIFKQVPISIKILYSLILVFAVVIKNIDDICFLLQKKDNTTNSLFNVYYINYSKVLEICMLIDNKIKSHIERSYKDEYTERKSAGLFGEINKSPLKIGGTVSEENSNTMTYEYKELQEIKNTNSTFLQLLIQKCKTKDLSSLKNGDLVKIDDVSLKIINKDEIVQVNSMVSGVFNGNVISAENDGQQININLNAITNILLKDYRYHLLCESNEISKFYISIPMKANKELESDYSIYDLEIGKVNIIGIYRTDKYDYQSYITTYEYLQEMGSTKQDVFGDELISSAKYESEIQHSSVKNDFPYIDLIAIIQDLDIKKGDNNE